MFIHTVIDVLSYPGQLTISPDDTSICKGESVSLVVNGAGTISWLEPASANDTITVMPTRTKGYTAVAVDMNGCVDTATALVNVEDFQITLTANEPHFVVGEQMYLIASGNMPYMVNGWTPAELFPNQYETMQPRVADIGRAYTVFGESLAGGCKDTASIYIGVDTKQTIFFPNVFSPNGDGLNDFIFPLSNKKFTMITFSIYNRWGNLVYHWQYGERGWNGKYKGEEADQGVYVYYFKLALDNQELVEQKGNLTLVR